MVVMSFVHGLVVMFTKNNSIPAKDVLKPTKTNVTNLTKPANTAKEKPVKYPIDELLGEVYFFARQYMNAHYMVHDSDTCNVKFWENDLGRARAQLEWALAVYRFQLHQTTLNK